jgi:tetratricopeptide (TPR) repeat protein
MMTRNLLAAVWLVFVLVSCQTDESPDEGESSVDAGAVSGEQSAAEGERLIDAALERRGRGEYLLALEAGNEALRIAQASGNLPLAAQAHNVLGIIENSRDNPAAALRHGLEELRIYENLGDPSGLSKSLNNIGNSYRHLGDYEKSLDYHRRSLAIKLERGDQDGAGYSHHNIGEVLAAQGRFEEALESYERAETEWQAVGNRRAVAAALKSEGVALESLGRLEESLRQLRASIALRDDPPNPHGEAETLVSLCRVLLRVGRPDEAVRSCRRAVTLAEGLGQTILLGDALAGLAAAESAIGNLSVTGDLLEKQLALQGRMREQERSRLRSEMQATLTAYEAERNAERLEREAELHEENVRRGAAERNLALLVAVLLLVTTGMALYGFRNKRNSERRLRQQAEDLEQALTQVRTLRGLLPLCAWCHVRVRDDEGEWTPLETFVQEHTDVVMTHSICPECQKANFPERSDGGAYPVTTD